MRSIVAGVGLALLACAGPADARTALLLGLAYWEPDRGTPYQWFEGAKEIESFFSEDYRAAGYIKAYVVNEGDEATSLAQVLLNQRPLRELREEHSVVWWRLLPDPLPPGAVGEVLIRLREPLAETALLEIEFSDGTQLAPAIGPTPRPVRIETVGFNESMDRVFLVVESLDGRPHRLKRLLIDNEATVARILDARFQTGTCPIIVDLPAPQEEGSYHVYSVEVDDTKVACCVRTYDGWVPLGTYGYTGFEEFARNGCNGHNNFGRFTKGHLDSHATLLMRGVNIIGDAPPADYMIGHPGLWAYCLQDEPDVKDYFVEDLPHAVRIGYHAMEMERRCQTCRRADPKTPTLLTLDLTYKPANFYVYGPLADITNVDCYTRAIGADLKMVREVVETARYGAGPHPLTFTFESYFLQPDDPAKLEERRFPRPPMAEELRMSIYYALGAGARGLYNYIHCTERAGSGVSHGAKDYPDLWREIGRAYREIGIVAPLLALAHPTRLATSADEGLWLRTLIAGEDALLVICANDDYDEERTAFRFRARENAEIRVPPVPWLSPAAAWRVTEKGLAPLAVEKRGEDTIVTLDRLEVAEMILIAADAALADDLWARQVELERDRAEALLREWRRRQDAEARRAHAIRRLEGEFADRIVMGSGIGAYGAKPEGYWNPATETYWAFEFGHNERGEAPDSGAEWTITVTTENAGKPHSIYAICGSWGQAGEFVLESPDGEPQARWSVSGAMSPGRLVRLQTTLAKPGVYHLSFLLKGPGPKGGRIAHAIFVIPDELDPPAVP